MIHPEIQRMMVQAHIETLLQDARAPRRPEEQAPREDTSRIELRLCTVNDAAALADLAALNDRPLPRDSFVVALVDGRLVAALPISGEPALVDPFVKTAHLRPLLAMRAAQLGEPGSRVLAPLRAMRRVGRRAAV